MNENFLVVHRYRNICTDIICYLCSSADYLLKTFLTSSMFSQLIDQDLVSVAIKLLKITAAGMIIIFAATVSVVLTVIVNIIVAAVFFFVFH